MISLSEADYFIIWLKNVVREKPKLWVLRSVLCRPGAF